MIPPAGSRAHLAIQGQGERLGALSTSTALSSETFVSVRPQLFVPNGHRAVNGVAAVDSDGTAADIMLEVPAVGRNGGAPLKGFLNQ